MGVPKPLPKEEASQEVHEIYDEMKNNFGRMPNIFGVMARHPEALKHFVPFYVAATGKGAVDDTFKELAYLKASHVNGCAY